MKISRFVCILTLAAAAILSALPSLAGPTVTNNLSAAITAALQEGKMIMTDFGTSTCEDCGLMDNVFSQVNPPNQPVRQWLEASCVIWRADVNASTDWKLYTGGVQLGMPMLFFIDPRNAFPEGTYTTLTHGYKDPTTFLNFLQNQARRDLPLVVTNIPAGALSNAQFTVMGIARTNAAFRGSITNAAISAIMWRLNGSGDFQPATGTTTWAADVTLSPGVNTFESFVLYEGDQPSWTNRVKLVSNGQAVASGPNITIPPASRTNAVGTTATFTVSASGTTPFSYQWQKDGGDLANDVRVSGATTSALGITGVQTNDAGDYRVVITNSYGSQTSTVATLTVIPPDSTPPTLDITSHTNLQHVTATPIILTGTASDAGTGDSGIASVTVNGVRAAHDTASGSSVANWSESVSLAAGPNTLTVVATDVAGNPSTNVIEVILDIVDTVPPTVTITAPTPNQRWSNAVFTVRGTAHDNVQVAGVYCQLNGGAWLPASTANGWTNWTLDVALSAGTNRLAVYGQDAAGNRSSTNTVALVYVLSDRLTVVLVGNGTVLPSDNNALLEIGKRYTLMARPASGFALSNWVGTVLGTTVFSSNSVVLTFVMQSNLVITVSFKDGVRPSLVITSPVLNQRWSNAVFTAKGTARDNLQVAAVWCQLNGGDWLPASTSNGWTNWTVDLTLSQRTNVLKAFAVDDAGNRSPTNSVSFIYVMLDQLTLQTSGSGRVSPDYSNAVLEVGKSYTLTATPGSSYVFSNWVGSVAGVTVLSGNAAVMSFPMLSNLVLQANFVPNPFLALKGTYNGLFYPTDNSYMSTNATGTNSGTIKLTLTDQGGLSGNLWLGGSTLSFIGKLTVQLQAQISVTRFGKTPLALAVQLNPALEDPVMQTTTTNVFTGTVADGDQWTSDLCAYRAATGTSNEYAGAYTLFIEGCNDWGLCFGDGFTTLPDGDGPETVKIGSGGAIQVSGTLADGANILQSAVVSEQDCWPLFVSLYRGKGFLAGWIALATNQVSSYAYWMVPPGASGGAYSNGFFQSRSVLLTPYVAPARGESAVDWTNGFVQITGGNLPMPANPADAPTSQVVVSNNQVQVISGTITNLTLSITTSNGLFKGTFLNPVSGGATTFHGVLLQDPNTPFDGGGWWLGPHGESGNIRLQRE